MKQPDPWTDFYSDTPIHSWLIQQLKKADEICSNHGKYKDWQSTLQQLSKYTTENYEFSTAIVKIGNEEEIDKRAQVKLDNLLKIILPWRKGPFRIFGTKIDSEWRSDFKWKRLEKNISSLKSRRVLDVGCGNGYFMFRMLGNGAKSVLGIDPTIHYNVQFKALSQLISNNIDARILPVGIDELPSNTECFDSVFSMGILYHRRSPIDHLSKLYSCLRPGGELILETLILDRPDDHLLVPAGRYAKMRNVWFIPTPTALTVWLQRTGFKNIKIVDICPTELTEQRSTPWMSFESLSDFLDPNDQTKTIEGHPAPVRTIIIANR